MTRLDQLAPYDEDHVLRAVVEVPKGATVKLKFEPKTGVFTVSRSLPLGIAYPFDWGFVPGTLAEDGDPVDALVLSDQPSYPGVVVPCRAIGVLQLEQRGKSGKRERNDRLLVLPREHERLGKLRNPASLPKQMRDEIARFFLNVTFFTWKDAKVLGWKGPQAASALLVEGVRAYERRRDKD